MVSKRDTYLVIAILAWVICAGVAYIFALRTIDASFVDGRFFPVYGDSFYHARRILDVFQGSMENFHFDSNAYAPEGTWVTWPWLYDKSMAALVHVAIWVSGNDEPEYLLFKIPALWVFVNFALLATVLALFRVNILILITTLLCFAFSPLMQFLHSFGRVDHHFAELTVLLAFVATTTKWLQVPDSRIYALMAGIVLGLAPGIHNGLFILYLPLLAAFFLSWCRGEPGMDRKSVLTFVVSTNLVLLALLMFSEPFRQGLFAYYYFSLFHLYFSLVCSSLAVYISLVPCNRRAIVLLIVMAVVLSLPLVGNLIHGYTWLDAEVPFFSNISELQPLFDWRESVVSRAYRLTGQFGIFVFLIPFALCGVLILLIKGSVNSLVFLGLMLLLCLLLWMHQQRFAYFGWPLLVIFCAVIADFGLKQIRYKSYPQNALTVAVCIGLLVNPLITYSSLDRFRPAMGVPDYPLVLFLVDKLKELCNKDKGIVLADAQFGHLIRYLTECPVISNTMFNTVQHYKKAIQTEAMLHLTPVEIQREYPWVKYVLVVKAVYNKSGDLNSGNGKTKLHPLTVSLLDNDSRIPGIDRMLLLNISQDSNNEVYGGLFKFPGNGF